jgi:type II secretory pathway pseudopilin PulG
MDFQPARPTRTTAPRRQHFAVWLVAVGGAASLIAVVLLAIALVSAMSAKPQHQEVIRQQRARTRSTEQAANRVQSRSGSTEHARIQAWPFTQSVADKDHDAARQWMRSHVTDWHWEEASWKDLGEYSGQFGTGRRYQMDFTRTIYLETMPCPGMLFYIRDGEVLWPYPWLPPNTNPGVPPDYIDFMKHLMESHPYNEEPDTSED